MEATFIHCPRCLNVVLGECKCKKADEPAADVKVDDAADKKKK
jgi:hypothetical protein